MTPQPLPHDERPEQDADIACGRGEETGEMCPRCGKPLVKNFSRKLKREFIGCSGYKDGCKYIKPTMLSPINNNPLIATQLQ